MSGSGTFRNGCSTYGLGSVNKKPWNGKLKKDKRYSVKPPTDRVYATFEAKRVDKLLETGLSIAAICRDLGYEYNKVSRAYRLARSAT